MQIAWWITKATDTNSEYVMLQPVVPYTHTTGSKLRRQTLTKHTKNICEPLRVISVKHSSVLPDDGSHTIRNILE